MLKCNLNFLNDCENTCKPCPPCPTVESAQEQVLYDSCECENINNIQMEAPCFGPCAMGYANILGDLISDECYDSQFYALLARYAPCKCVSRALCRLSKEEADHARMLQTAYYLITGRHFWPRCRTINGNDFSSFCAALRNRYMEEQKSAALYRALACKTKDKCLEALFLHLAEDEEEHARVLYRIIEKVCVPGCVCDSAVEGVTCTCTCSNGATFTCNCPNACTAAGAGTGRKCR